MSKGKGKGQALWALQQNSTEGVPLVRRAAKLPTVNGCQDEAALTNNDVISLEHPIDANGPRRLGVGLTPEPHPRQVLAESDSMHTGPPT